MQFPNTAKKFLKKCRTTHTVARSFGSVAFVYFNQDNAIVYTDYTRWSTYSVTHSAATVIAVRRVHYRRARDSAQRHGNSGLQRDGRERCISCDQHACRARPPPATVSVARNETGLIHMQTRL